MLTLRGIITLLVLAVCLLLLMFCSRVSLKKIGVILLPACIAAFGLFVMGLYYARGGNTQTMDLSSLSAMPYSVRAAMSQNLYTALQLATRLLAYAGLGILFALSTEGDFFIASLLHQCHLAPKFAYGILAAHYNINASQTNQAKHTTTLQHALCIDARLLLKPTTSSCGTRLARIFKKRQPDPPGMRQGCLCRLTLGFAMLRASCRPTTEPNHFDI